MSLSGWRSQDYTEDKSDQSIEPGMAMKESKDAGSHRNPARGALPSEIVALPAGGQPHSLKPPRLTS